MRITKEGSSSESNFMAGFPEGMDGILAWNSAKLAGIDRFLEEKGLRRHEWSIFYQQNRDTALQLLAEFFGASSFEDWLINIRPPVYSPAIPSSSVSQEHLSTDKATSIRSEPISEGLKALGVDRDFLRIEDLKTPAVQRFITDTEVPVNQIIDVFLAIQDGFPDAFVCHQIHRILSSYDYEDAKRRYGSLAHPYGGVRYGLGNFKFDWLFAFWRNKFIPGSAKWNSKSDADQNEMNTNLEELRRAILKLNQLILENEDASAFDWENFRAEIEE